MVIKGKFCEKIWYSMSDTTFTIHYSHANNKNCNVGTQMFYALYDKVRKAPILRLFQEFRNFCNGALSPPLSFQGLPTDAETGAPLEGTIFPVIGCCLWAQFRSLHFSLRNGTLRNWFML